MDAFDEMLKKTGLEIATEVAKTRTAKGNDPKDVVLENIRAGINAARAGEKKAACWKDHPIHKDKYLIKLRYGTKVVMLNEKSKSGLDAIKDKDNKSLIVGLQGLEKYVLDGHADEVIKKLASEQAEALKEGQARNKAWIAAYPELAKDHSTRAKYLKAMKEAEQDAHDVEWAIKDGSKIARKVVIAAEKTDKAKSKGENAKSAVKQAEATASNADKEAEEALAKIDPKVLDALMAKISKK